MDGSGNAVADIVRIGAVCIGAWGLVDVWVIRLFYVKHKFSEKIAKYEPQATEKFFGAAVFQKCCRGVGEQPTFAKQIILQQVLPAAIALF